jgi:hypothetical protein
MNEQVDRGQAFPNTLLKDLRDRRTQLKRGLAAIRAITKVLDKRGQKPKARAQ